MSETLLGLIMEGANTSPSSCTDPLPLQPTLFILKPLLSSAPADVCLAAHFRPKDGEMVVNGHKQETGGAVLSHRHKSFFLAGFNKSIEDCKLHESFISVHPGSSTVFIPLNVCVNVLNCLSLT